MKAWEHKIAPAGFLLAGVLFLFAAVKPTFVDQPLNAAFFILGIAFLIFGFVFWRRISGTQPPGSE